MVCCLHIRTASPGLQVVDDFNNLDITKIHSERLGIGWRQAHGHKNVRQWEKQKKEEGSQKLRELKKVHVVCHQCCLV